MNWWKRPRDTDDDFEFFLGEETAENIARGMTPSEARLAARRKFGNTLRMSEEIRAVWLPVWLDDFGQDLRYAWRTFRRAKLLTVTLLLMLALGVSVNTAVFSLVNALLLRPLPYPDPERLVSYSDEGRAARYKSGILVADFDAWRQRARSFEALAGYQYQDSILSTSNSAVTVKTVTTAGDFWRIVGAHPMFGRLFAESDSAGGVVLSYRIFAQFFAGDRAVIGTEVLLAGTPVTVIGILPPNFRFLLPQDRAGLELREPDVFQPAGLLLSGDRRRLSVVGRLRPEVTISTALKEIKGLQSSLLQESPDRWFAGTDLMNLRPLREGLTAGSAQALTILQIAGLLVLLIACANVAGLLLARGLARQREVCIRVAIGAGRGRLLRQYLCEGLFLATLGGAGGILLARLLLWGMHQWGSRVLPRLTEAELDTRVLLFATVLSFSSALLFCFWPAVLSGVGHDGMLRSRGASGSSRSKTLRMALSGVELGIAVVLAIGAGLMIRSFGAMYTAVPGFEPTRVLVMRLSLAGTEYKEKSRVAATVSEIEAALASLPGVTRAGVAERQAYLLQSANSAVPNVVDRFDESLVTPGYFASIGMRLLRGRWIEEGDRPDAAVINETLARRVFGTEDPTGKPITKLGRPVRVVGVTADLKYSRMDETVVPELFRGYAQNIGARPSLLIAIRVDGDATSLALAARRRLAEIAPMQAIHGVQTLEAQLADSIAPRWLNLALMLGFAAISLVMAVIGIYGAMAYSVTQRTQEIGIKRALGATQLHIVGSVLRSGMGPALVGTIMGLLTAIGFARWMTSLIYGVEPLDLLTFTVAPVLLMTAATVACLIPAMKASQIDPLSTLRAD